MREQDDGLPTVITIVLAFIGLAVLSGWQVWTQVRDGVLEVTPRGVAPAQHRYYVGTESAEFWIHGVLFGLLSLFFGACVISAVARLVRVNRRLRRRRLSR